MTFSRRRVSHLAAGAVAQGHPDSRQQFGDSEGLGQVVVGSRVERLNLLRLLVTYREHQDGGGRPFSHHPGDLDPVEAACARLIPSDATGPGALEAGVRGYLLKESAQADLIKAIRAIHAGDQSAYSR